MVAYGLVCDQTRGADHCFANRHQFKGSGKWTKVTFSFDWDLTGKSVKEGDTFTIDAPEGVNILKLGPITQDQWS